MTALQKSWRTDAYDAGWDESIHPDFCWDFVNLDSCDQSRLPDGAHVSQYRVCTTRGQLDAVEQISAMTLETRGLAFIEMNMLKAAVLQGMAMRWASVRDGENPEQYSSQDWQVQDFVNALEGRDGIRLRPKAGNPLFSIRFTFSQEKPTMDRSLSDLAFNYNDVLDIARTASRVLDEQNIVKKLLQVRQHKTPIHFELLGQTIYPEKVRNCPYAIQL